MFGRSVTLFKLLGFQVKVDLSWLILAALITWSLASGLFPEYYKDLPVLFYWLMGVGGAIGLFLSIVVPVSYTHLRAHETPEQLVCRLLLEKKKKKKDCLLYTPHPQNTL